MQGYVPIFLFPWIDKKTNILVYMYTKSHFYFGQEEIKQYYL